MGNTPSNNVAMDPRHARIWTHLAALQSNDARAQMLETLLSGPEYVNAAKRAGIYSAVLTWLASYRRGDRPYWPSAAPSGAPSAVPSGVPNAALGSAAPNRAGRGTTTLATVPPPKKALDAIHEAYRVLGIDDSKPLTHEALKTYYRKASVHAHPDRGGSAEKFNEITKSFLYLEEVLNKLSPRAAAAGSTVAAAEPGPRMVVEDFSTTDLVVSGAAAPATVPTRYQPPVNRRATAAPPPPERPPVSLNPKNLNMTVFNQLFEENRLPDPDQEGYGDWFKSADGADSNRDTSALRSKFNKDVFNKMFSEGQQGATDPTTTGQPSEIFHSAGVELGGGRPTQFTAALGAKMGYTDLKFAYGEGSTFSRDIANVQTGKQRTFDELKRERESAPVPLSEHELAAVEAIRRQREAMEADRLRRLTTQDNQTEQIYNQLQSRIRVQK
jgi:hypothetical protein